MGDDCDPENKGVSREQGPSHQDSASHCSRCLLAGHYGRELLRPASLIVILIALLNCACLSTHLPPLSKETGAFTPLADERTLWSQSRQEEQTINAGQLVYTDPTVDGYLGAVLERITPPALSGKTEAAPAVHVVLDPRLNAFALPHGAIYVTTGLLAALETEDQLAAVLGHELTHIENRHQLREDRALRNRQITFATIGAIGSAAAYIGESKALADHNYAKASSIDQLAGLFLGPGLQTCIPCFVQRLQSRS